MRPQPTRRDGTEQTRESTDGRSGATTPTRRTFMKASGAAVVGTAFGLGISGSASAVGIDTPWLEREGNRIVDEDGQRVILRGVNMADPGRCARDWRGKGPMDVFDLATNTDEGWYNRIVRVPTQPQDIADAGSGGVGSMPHGDDWGPLLPGQFDRSDLETYFADYVDPLVDAAAERGLYIMIDYHRHFPIFHQPQHEEDLGDYECGTESFEDDIGFCGERGVLWHSEAQAAELADEGYTEEYAAELDEELRLYWDFVAPRYAEESHVLYDVYNEPTGPYAGDWGSPTELPHDGNDEGGEDVDVTNQECKRYWDMWVERAQPWIDVVRDHAPRNLITIGSPRWSQYTYWAPENEFDGENICYTGHAYTHDDLRPLGTYFGEPAEEVPVFFSEFGWADGGGRDGFQFLEGTADEYADEFETFIDSYPVHPIAWCFDHTWEPSFFVHDESQDGDWVLHDYQDRPGQWWQEYLEEHREDDLPGDGIVDDGGGGGSGGTGGGTGGTGGSGGDGGSNGDTGGGSQQPDTGDVNAELEPSTTSASVGERITFRVQDTTGNGTWLDSLEWDFDDGTTGSGWWNAHSYDSAGTYTVALMATDNEGTTTTHEVEITVS